MAKTYQLKALWPLLPFEVAAAPLLATLDAYGGGLIKYAVSHDGIWLFSPSEPFTVHESEGLTGFHPADLVPKQIDGVVGYFYAMQGGAPLLPLPFTADQLTEFDKRTAGLIVSCIERGSETDAWIADLGKHNPDAAELARGIHGGKWPVATTKPRFNFAGGIVPDASAKAVSSAFGEMHRQQDQMRLMGITPDLLKQINLYKDYEKLISPTSIEDTAYMRAMQSSGDMLRAIGPSSGDLAAEALGRQLVSTVGFDTAGSVASAYLQSQSTVQAEIEKAMGGNIGSVADAYRQAQYPQQTELEKITALMGGSVANPLGLLDRAGLDVAMGRYHQPTASEMFEQMERERIEKAMAPPERSGTVVEFTRPSFSDHQAAINRQRERDREHAIETARLAEIARLEARDEYEARKQVAPAPAAPVGVETQEARQKRRYDLCIAAGLQMPSDDYSHLPTGIGALARAENISTAAFSKDVKAYIVSRR